MFPSSWIHRRPATASTCDGIDFNDSPELDDLIPQKRCFLELEIARGSFHLRFEVLDHSREFVSRQLGDYSCSARTRCTVLAMLLGDSLDAFGQVSDLLDNASRFDAVLLVIRDLKAPPAIGFIDGRLHRARHCVRI